MSKEIMSFAKLNSHTDRVVSAKDYTLTLENGKLLTDTMSGLWTTPLGYSNDIMKAAMTNQLNKLPYASNFSGNQSETTERYAEALCKKTNMNRVYFTNSGSTAVETAIKLTGKNVAICGEHSYHGSTILSANVSDQGINKFWGIQNPMSIYKFERADDLYANCKGLFDLSFVIIEPVVGAGGVYEWEHSCWDILEEYQESGGYVILDETVTGFGKLGPLFGFEKYNFKPDILVLGKAITNGYFPMGACLINERIEKQNKMFNHGFTFSGHPVGSSAGFVMLKELEQRNEWLLNHDRFSIRLENVKEHRQIGCMGAIDFETPKQSLTFIKKMRERGYILEDGSENMTTAVYCLPYIMTQEDYHKFMENIKECI
tara:strand:- start:26799 stop:27917 length:1119 start_codon:yes stop_codon:yes gene_type:complete